MRAVTCLRKAMPLLAARQAKSWLRFSKSQFVSVSCEAFGAPDHQGLHALWADRGFTSSKVKVAEDPNVGKHLLATARIGKGELVFVADLSVEGRMSGGPTTHSVQVASHQHIDTTRVPDQHGGLLRYLSHQKEPTLQALIHSNQLEFVARRDIDPGEELGFHYCTTEWSMGDPFECAHMGSQISGFKELDALERERLIREGLVAHHLMSIARSHGLYAS